MAKTAEKLAIIASERRTSRKGFLKRWAQLIQERQPLMGYWRELGRNFLPRRSRFLRENAKPNAGEQIDYKTIINNTPTIAARVFRAGMTSSASSQARPWFRLITPYPSLMDVQSVRLWLHEVEERIRITLIRSNFYTCAPIVYRDLGVWGTAAVNSEEDPETRIRFSTLPIGTYALQNGARGMVDTIYREVRMTVGQIVEKWGDAVFENASQVLKDAWKSNKHDQEITLLHVIEPNQDYDATKADVRGKRYRSVWLEVAGDQEGKPIAESGYHEFPAMCPRWDLDGEEVYGSSPGMDALGDARGLQRIERDKLNAIKKIVDPAMVGPTSLENKRRSLISGDTTFSDTSTGSQKFEPAHIVDPRIAFVGEEIGRHENRVRDAFYNQLFLMFASMDQAQPPTAREVDERHEEKVQQIGDPLERIHGEFLAPVIERVFAVMMRAGDFDDLTIPTELQGLDIRIEFTSPLAQAQKLVGTAAVEHLITVVGNMAPTWPQALDKIDPDEVVDELEDMLGTSPKLVRSGDALQAIRDARAKQQQAAAMAAAAKPASDAANAAATLSNVDQGSGALNRLVSAITPNQPQAVA